jgi:hypothetical protein
MSIWAVTIDKLLPSLFESFRITESINTFSYTVDDLGGIVYKSATFLK